MREIKFRGKSPCFGTWLYGDLVRAGDTTCICEKGSMEMDGHHIRQFADRPQFVLEKTIGQFSGQYDKNNKEIYEGDIVSWEYPTYDSDTGYSGKVKSICEVTFKYGSFRINAYPYNLGRCEDFFEDEETYGLEVIGNKHDNPELLSKKV